MIPDDPAELAEAPISARAVLRGVDAAPRAAAVALDLLRTIDVSDMARGLVQESLAYGLLQGSAEHTTWLEGQTRPRRLDAPGHVHVTRSGAVVDVVIDHPSARGAIDRGMRDALHEAFTVAALDPDVETVRLRGTGRSFCVGADLGEFGTTRDPATAHMIRMATLPAWPITDCADKFEAHIAGACIGAGLEMVAFAKRLTATSDTWFQLPELAMGLIPGAGGCVSVTRRIGRRRAALLILSSKRISARVALDWGLIDAIVDDDTTRDRQPDIVRRQP